MTSFRIPHKPDSWNILVRKHYRTVMRVFEMWHSLTYAALRDIDAQPINGPVRIEVVARWKTKRAHDIDNILLKPILDTVVKYGILKGDDVRYVVEIKLQGLIDQVEESIEVNIIPVVLRSASVSSEASGA
jgi:Holliday junction resolvase RusA-like endonuclease